MQQFTLVDSLDLKSKKLKVNYYIHQKTGAKIISVLTKDKNKVFGINFRTPPANNTGLPHILEHSVLCGSKKYPVKEPFVELLKSSLQTFLNAMTYPDKTCYPVASTNLKDFYNLVDVYLDAVFFPLLHPFTFAQEGWHYELNSLEDELKIKGVVYNEMKGAYSSPDSLLAEYSQQSLFPDTIYRFDAGGKPEEIVKLTYEEFLNFHRTYYHPSNAWIYFYGDDPEEKRLEALAPYLDKFESKKIDSQIPLQARKKLGSTIKVPYGTSKGEKKGFFTLNWLLTETFNLEVNFAFRILEELLIGLPSSPLRKNLIESGLGEGLAGIGLETELRQMYFSVGLKGILLEDIPKAEEIIWSTLRELASNIDKKLFQAAFNSVEFRLKENNTGSFPQGLSWMLRLLSIGLYKDEFFSIFDLNSILDKLRQKDLSFWKSLIKEYFLDNSHLSKVILEPKEGLLEKKELEAKKELEVIKNKLSAKELEEIVKRTQEIINYQQRVDKPEDVAKIPSLKVADIPLEVEEVKSEIITEKKYTLFLHPLSEEDLVYLDIGFSLEGLKEEELVLVPTLGKLFLEMGTKRRDYVGFNNELYAHTGGIVPEIVLEEHVETKKPLAYLFFRSKVLAFNFSKLLSLLKEIFTEFSFEDGKRLKEILLEEKAYLERSIVPGGHLLVLKRLNSKFSVKGKLKEALEGIDYYFKLKNILINYENRWDELLDKYRKLVKKLFKNSVVVNITLPEDKVSLKKSLDSFLKEIFMDKVNNYSWSFNLDSSNNEGFIIPAQVNYIGMGLKLDKEYLGGSFLVLSKFLRNVYLWDKIRVEGGAYGAFALANIFSGEVYFVSYRDPNDFKTLDVYERVAYFLEKLSLSEREVEKLIIASIGELEKHQLADAKAFNNMLFYLKGLSLEKRKQRKEEVLSTRLKDLQENGKKLSNYLKKQVVALGKEDSILRLKEKGKVEEVSKIFEVN